MIAPFVHFPLYLEKEGNPYKWVPFRDADGFYKVPSHQDGRNSVYLVSCEGERYELLDMGGQRPMGDISRLPFTHWFSKPIDIGSRIRNRENPILMEHDVEYLVNIHGQLKIISVETIMRDALPILAWYDDKDIFSLR